MYQQGLIDSYRRRGHVTSNLAKFKPRLKVVEFLNIHSVVQTADVTIISYKPLSDLNLLGTHNTMAVTCPLLLWSL